MQTAIDHTTYRAAAKNFRQSALVLHYTELNFQDSLSCLTGSQVSCHYLVPTLKSIDPSYPHDKLMIYCLVEEMERAWHAGISAWQKRTNLNDTSIGIEIVNLGAEGRFLPYPEEQVNVLIQLCQDILSRYPDIIPTRVVGHSDIAIGRKQDPGPLFPWHELYLQGIGAWFDEENVAKYMADFAKQMPSASEVLIKIQQYGYDGGADAKDMVKAFQMHFRPRDFSGTIDLETAAIAYALCDKYVLD